ANAFVAGERSRRLPLVAVLVVAVAGAAAGLTFWKRSAGSPGSPPLVKAPPSTTPPAPPAPPAPPRKVPEAYAGLGGGRAARLVSVFGDPAWRTPGLVRLISVSPDGKTLVTGGRGQGLLAWDSSSGEIVSPGPPFQG